MSLLSQMERVHQWWGSNFLLPQVWVQFLNISLSMQLASCLLNVKIVQDENLKKIKIKIIFSFHQHLFRRLLQLIFISKFDRQELAIRIFTSWSMVVLAVILNLCPVSWVKLKLSNHYFVLETVILHRIQVKWAVVVLISNLYRLYLVFFNIVSHELYICTD